MKRLLSFALIVTAVFSQYRCGDKGEILPDINLDKVLEKSIPVSVITKEEMTATVILDATDDSEIAKYENKIKQYEITSLKFVIENYSSPLDDEIYFDGTIGFGKQGADFPGFECSVNSMPVTHWAGTDPFSIGNCDNLIDKIAVLLQGENGMKIFLKGVFTNEPLTFELKVIANVKITANPS